MKSLRTKKCDISLNVRKEVIDRDCGCVVCKKTSSIEIAHFIPRSQNGLGIKENLVVLCKTHHDLMDNSIYQRQYRNYVADYLKSFYNDWNEEKLVYKGVRWELNY